MLLESSPSTLAVPLTRKTLVSPIRASVFAASRPATDAVQALITSGADLSLQTDLKDYTQRSEGDNDERSRRTRVRQAESGEPAGRGGRGGFPGGRGGPPAANAATPDSTATPDPNAAPDPNADPDPDDQPSPCPDMIFAISYYPASLSPGKIL